jgi:hypothetical protein
VGDAFLAQPNDVMDSVQRLRAAAQQSGNLESNAQQKVIVEEAPQTIIKIEPVTPQVVYVPAYNPTAFYGTWWYPSYPPVYLPPPPGYVFGTALVSGIAFGIGVGITNSLWGGCDWGRGDVDIDINHQRGAGDSGLRPGSQLAQGVAMKKAILPFVVLCLVIAGCTCYQTAPGYYGPGASPESKFDRSWSAAVGAFEDRGARVTTADRPAGFLSGRRGAIDVTANLRSQADGSVRVEFNTAGETGRDPGLINRISGAYDRRMGR